VGCRDALYWKMKMKMTAIPSAIPSFRLVLGKPRVSAITSPAWTGAKVYYQSGPMAAMLGGVDIGSPSAANVHASH